MSLVDQVLDETLSFIRENDWCGACYATSAINHILLKELGVESELCIGVFKAEISHIEGSSPCYDHAWIEIDKKIYDIAITKGLRVDFGPEYIPLNGVRGNCNEYFRYGINIELEQEVQEMVIPFSKYMKTNPCFNGSIDYWDVLDILGKRLGLNTNRDALVSKYQNVAWTLVNSR